MFFKALGDALYGMIAVLFFAAIGAVFMLLKTGITLLRSRAQGDSGQGQTFKRFGLTIDKQRFVQLTTNRMSKQPQKKLWKMLEKHQTKSRQFAKNPAKSDQAAYHAAMEEALTEALKTAR